jgi:hypothetical protein
MSVIDLDTVADAWICLKDAAAETGASVSALYRAYQAGDLPHRTVQGRFGSRVEVRRADAHAWAQRCDPAGSEIVLASVFARLENLTAQLVDAGTRAARSEARVELLSQQLEQARVEVLRLRQREDAVLALAAAGHGTIPRPRRRRLWNRASVLADQPAVDDQLGAGDEGRLR